MLILSGMCNVGWEISVLLLFEQKCCIFIFVRKAEKISTPERLGCSSCDTRVVATVIVVD